MRKINKKILLLILVVVIIFICVVTFLVFQNKSNDKKSEFAKCPKNLSGLLTHPLVDYNTYV